MAERKLNARNVYADCFTESYLNHYGMPYIGTQADYVQLHALMTGILAERLTLEVWQRGVGNYFQSERGEHTLRHLCSKFVPYWRGPMDRYGKPKDTTNRVGMRTAGEVSGLPWPIKFLQKMNAIGKAHPEKTEALNALLDEIEGLDESSAMALLAEIEADEILA